MQIQQLVEMIKLFKYVLRYTSGGGGAIRSLPRDGGVEELHGDPQSGHAPRSGSEVKNRRVYVKNGAPERLRCWTIQKEVS